MNTYEIKIEFFVSNLRGNNHVIIRTEAMDHGHDCALCQCKTRELAEAMVKNLEMARTRAIIRVVQKDPYISLFPPKGYKKEAIL